jgi:hypothetical protein
MVKIKTIKRDSRKTKTPAKISVQLGKSSNAVSETIRGRKFTQQDLLRITKLVKKFFKHGRTRISIEVCKDLKWQQPNGWLKDRACREVLHTLAEKKYFRLPKSKNKINNTIRYSEVVQQQLRNLDRTPITSMDLFSLEYRQVKGDRDESLWNLLVDKYHYLGFKVFVGRNLKYLIYSEGRIVAALGLCDPAWSITARDVPLTKMGFDIDDIRARGINNGRFLIMPWVTVENLASRILSLAINHFVADWASYYSVTPILMETFVDPSRFNGTCYKAANWFYLGHSRGYFKSGPTHHNSQTRKMLFVYPLTKDLKVKLGRHVKESENAIPDL